GLSRTYDGFAVQGLESGRNKSTLGNWWRETAGSRDLASMVQKSAQNFDLVHAHHKLSILAAAQTGFPFFATVRDYWPICPCGRSIYRTDAACSVYDFTRCSEEEHGVHGLLTPLAFPWFDSRMRLRRTLLGRATRIFCISRYVRQQLLPFFPESQLVWMPNFAEDLPPAPTPELPERFAIYIGKLEPNKGAHLLPSLMQASSTTIPLVILGEGSLESALKREFADRGLDAIFLGYREAPEMLSILQRSEFLIFPSLWPEPLGRVLIEAAMKSKPAIAFGHPGGHHDILQNGINGILVENQDQFGAAIARLASDSDLRLQMGTAARKIYEERFSPNAIVTNLLVEYQALHPSGVHS
ncbi:MAG TPA: glycosyltransferase family 4 protein, partial [Acidobacteriota bacterium]|nr:glycosyltransferase family 4 protein [Acidobacteriota bacterium]